MKKTKKILQIVTTCIICISAIATGFFIGTKISDKYFSIDKYAGLTKEELMDDISNINYEDKTPDQLNATDVFNIAINILRTRNNYIRTAFGELETSIGITQFTNSRSGKTNTSHFQESSTYSSMIKRAGRFTYEEGEKIHYQEGTAQGNGLDTVEWVDEFTDYDYDEYEELIGRQLDYESTYIVSSKTAIESSQCAINGDEYTYTITLDPTLASLTYLKEISYVSDVDPKTINFQSITMEFTVNSKFEFIRQQNLEVYSLKYSGIPVTINATYNITYSY